MILAIDVYYFADKAKVTGIFFTGWTDETPRLVKSIVVNSVNAYEPGAFYKRELPCLVEFLKEVDLTLIEAIVIDGFVFLNNDGAKGLGAHLYEFLNHNIPIVGVAKSSFYSAKGLAREVFRGTSKNPLFITVAGTDLDHAADNVQLMAGDYRIPTLLKILDSETKNISHIYDY